MKPPLRRKFISEDASSDSFIVDASGEDIARVHGKRAAFSEETSRKILRAVNGGERLQKALEEAETALARYRASPKDLKPIDLRPLSRHADILFTSIRFEDELSDVLTTTDEKGVKHGHNWLEFGECSITNESRTCFLGAKMRNGITDFEHDSCYVARLDLIGLKYVFTNHHVTYLEANITPDIDGIRIYEPDFDPEKVQGSWRCKDRCEDKHLMLPDGYFTPPIYKLARVVAGRRVSIMMGPRWDVIEKREEPDE